MIHSSHSYYVGIKIASHNSMSISQNITFKKVGSISDQFHEECNSFMFALFFLHELRLVQSCSFIGESSCVNRWLRLRAIILIGDPIVTKRFFV